ncbi:MAG: hypothetical protein UV73_C0004G0150 [Candidatus Gottesmanbacteria bacterium GW2011_GWA2_43_14]|uniref:Uncharacterized protein n=1 Tax=Candidatus Gottesmanbacteria bacterium GW2011_GWA2_43_14 TaxID=1618443 RepID=A0A0G1GGS1_9BACT|nr:MAG: hypothetical protein UV73_C0004G0150 [Candidatus Gottesmanbacteria bacterium GW2011_GWA2_43_14]
MRQAVGAVFPFLFIHLICCGMLLFLLVSSGILFMLSQEASNKIFLLPALLLTALLFWQYLHHQHSCTLKGYKTFYDRLRGLTLYLLLSLTAGFIFIIYVFIPWWIPGYRGGILLP